VLDFFNELRSKRVGKWTFILKLDANDADFYFPDRNARWGSAVSAALRLGIRQARRTQSSEQNQNAEGQAYSASHIRNYMPNFMLCQSVNGGPTRESEKLRDRR
jgi:hypothetical protein